MGRALKPGLPSSRQTIRVLVVGGATETLWLIREWLVNSADLHFQIGRCADPADPVIAKMGGSYDVLLLAAEEDWPVQRRHLSHLKTILPATPVVVLGDENEEVAVEALHAGAHDYLRLASLTAPQLLRSVRYAFERSTIEREALVERILLSCVFDNLPGTVYVKDAEGRYLASNPGHRRRIGELRREMVIGRTVHDFCPPSRPGFTVNSTAACSTRVLKFSIARK